MLWLSSFAAEGQRVTVLPFSPKGSDHAWNGIGSGISELISAALTGCAIPLLRREKIGEFISQSTGDTSLLFDKEKVFSAGLSFDVATIIKGEYTLNRQSCTITAKIIDTRNGLIVQTISREINVSGDAIGAQADTIARAYCAYASISCKGNPTPQKQGTSTISALQEFGMGLDFHMGYYGTLDQKKAAFHYSRSLLIDSSFSLPRYYQSLLEPGIIQSNREYVQSQQKSTLPPKDSIQHNAIPSSPEPLAEKLSTTPAQTRDSTAFGKPKAPFANLDFSATYTLIENIAGYEVHKGYYDNGAIRQICLYKNGMLNNMSKLYYPHGKVLAEIKYVNNVPSGTCRKFFESGTPQENVTMFDGQREGTTTTFYPNGNPKETVEYTKGIQQGSCKRYYEKGPLAANFKYKNDMVDGDYREFYENGTFKRWVHYVNGIPRGKELMYHPNGKISQEIRHARFFNTAQIKGYYPTAEVSFTGKQANGRNNGLFRYYGQDHTLQRTEMFTDGMSKSDSDQSKQAKTKGSEAALPDSSSQK